MHPVKVSHRGIALLTRRTEIFTLSLKFEYKEVHFEFCPRLTKVTLELKRTLVLSVSYAFAN